MATLSVNEMRCYIKSIYKDRPGFCHRVDSMPDCQIIAIYYNMINRERKPSRKKKSSAFELEDAKISTYVQLKFDI